MARSRVILIRKGRPALQVRWCASVAAIAGLVLYTAVKALWSAAANDDFPDSLAVKLALLPGIFPLHMVTGGLALVLVPLAYALRRHRRWHRLAGWIATGDVALAGLTALPVALVAPVTAWSAAGFTVQASVWLGLLVTGIAAIRRRQLALHRRCMLLMAATTSGAVFFRVYLALWAIFGGARHFECFYAGDAWAAWLLPLAACALWLALEPRPGNPRHIPVWG